jgi:hypothetical protein
MTSRALLPLCLALACGGGGSSNVDGGPIPSRVPSLLTPQEAAGTGSIWAQHTESGKPGPLTPEFRWTAVTGAVRYEFEIDDSCASPADCNFPSPALQFSTPNTSFIPTAPLNVAMTPPVGRRYYWHVRACDVSSCGDWSRVSYAEVGRQAQDFNGDGYADVAIAAPTATSLAATGTPLGGAFVYLGAATVPASPSWTLEPDPGSSISWVRWIGDIDGDGFGDLAIVDGSAPDYADRVRVYRGGNPPVADPAIELTQQGSSITAVIGGGDLNGDGFADTIVAYQQSGSANVAVLPGGASLVRSMLIAPTPGTLVEACDWDFDNFADVILQSPGGVDVVSGSASAPLGGQMQSIKLDGGYEAIGCLHNFHGRGEASLLLLLAASPGSAAPLTTISSTAALSGIACDAPLPQVSGGIASPAPSSFRSVAHPGDMDHDGFDDVVVGDAPNNRAILFFGGCPPQRALVLPGGSNGFATPVAGYSVGAIGDINGDGFSDLAVGNPYEGIDSFGAGEVYLYLGGLNPSATPDSQLRSPISTPAPGAVDGFGASVD